MIVYGFSGESGSGKSFRAPWVASRLGIAAIIDDGLLISENKIIAGTSAKKEKTKIAAVRRALFTDPAHAAAVKRALAANHYAKVMIVGTSDNMVQKIAATLGLNDICHIIHIRDVATEAEIAEAKKIRATEGKHVIPVPTFEVKKDFSGYFIDSITSVLFPKSKKHSALKGEKTIVRPTFSYLGDYTISNNVLADICACEASKSPYVQRVVRSTIKNSPAGVYIDVDLVLVIGKYQLISVSKVIAKDIADRIEQMTSMNICKLNVNIKGLAP